MQWNGQAMEETHSSLWTFLVTSGWWTREQGHRVREAEAESHGEQMQTILCCPEILILLLPHVGADSLTNQVTGMCGQWAQGYWWLKANFPIIQAKRNKMCPAGHGSMVLLPYQQDNKTQLYFYQSLYPSGNFWWRRELLNFCGLTG